MKTKYLEIHFINKLSVRIEVAEDFTPSGDEYIYLCKDGIYLHVFGKDNNTRYYNWKLVTMFKVVVE